MRNVLYMAVTTDSLEMPIACAETLGELARLVGKSYASVSTSITKGYSGRRNGFRVLKITLDSDEEFT